MKKIIELFLTFFKLGLFTFGGGYAMIPQIKDIIVDKKNWLTNDDVLEIIAISESTPGPIAINMATFIGYRQKKVLGSIASTLGVVLPSLIIIFIISLFFDASFLFEGDNMKNIKNNMQEMCSKCKNNNDCYYNYYSRCGYSIC